MSCPRDKGFAAAFMREAEGKGIGRTSPTAWPLLLDLQFPSPEPLWFPEKKPCHDGGQQGREAAPLLLGVGEGT